MTKLYNINIVFQPDGRCGAAAYFYQDDGITPSPVPVPLHTADFPAASLLTLKDLLGDHADAIVAASAVDDTVKRAQDIAEENSHLRAQIGLKPRPREVNFQVLDTDPPEVVQQKLADLQAALVDLAQPLVSADALAQDAKAEVVTDAKVPFSLLKPSTWFG